METIGNCLACEYCSTVGTYFCSVHDKIHSKTQYDIMNNTKDPCIPKFPLVINIEDNQLILT